MAMSLQRANLVFVNTKAESSYRVLSNMFSRSSQVTDVLVNIPVILRACMCQYFKKCVLNR